MKLVRCSAFRVVALSAISLVGRKEVKVEGVEVVDTLGAATPGAN